jgi:hypothetical protein
MAALVTYYGRGRALGQLTKTGSASFGIYSGDVDTVDVAGGYTLTVYETENQGGQSKTVEGPAQGKSVGFDAYGWTLEETSTGGGETGSGAADTVQQAVSEMPKEHRQAAMLGLGALLLLFLINLIT